jgi:tRNA modification GTPase
MASTSQVATALLVQSRGAMDRHWACIAEAVDRRSRPEALEKIDSVRRWLPWSLQWLQPCRIALAGLPNAGKSSLLNAFAGFTRSIVHDTPGTTRDLVSQRIAIGGWPLELIDTAGLRQSSDEIESLGIAAARRILQEVDFVWLLTAADHPWTSEHEAWMEMLGERCWIVRTKCDLEPVGHLPDRFKRPAERIATVSVLEMRSVEQLARSWLDRWIPEGWTVEQPALFLPEQRERLERLWEAVSEEKWAISMQLLNCTDTSYRT